MTTKAIVLIVLTIAFIALVAIDGKKKVQKNKEKKKS